MTGQHRTNVALLTMSFVTVGILATWSWGAIFVDDLEFETGGRNMWGQGESAKMDITWDSLMTQFSDSGTLGGTALGTGGTLGYSYSGKAGLEPRLRIDSGTAGVEYPIRLTVPLPDVVLVGSQVTVNTSNWAHLPSLLATTGPMARFTLDALVQFKASIGPGAISAVGFDLVDINKTELVDLNKRTTLIDIGSGASSLEFDITDAATLTLEVPEQVVTSSSQLIPPELAKIKSSGLSPNKFLNMNVDVDSLIQKALGLPLDVLEADVELWPDDNKDGKADLSVEGTLLNVEADMGLKLAQQFTFLPQRIPVTMVSNCGQTASGHLGDSFTFVACREGELIIDATFDLEALLRNQTGFNVNASLTLQALKLVLHNEFGPDFDINLAKDLLGRDSDYLLDVQVPEGGINSPALYLFDNMFPLEGFEEQKTRYTVLVIPEPAALSMLILGVAALVRRRRAWPAAF